MSLLFFKSTDANAIHHGVLFDRKRKQNDDTLSGMYY